ncbi:hypothetical protein FHS77_002517 [Paenochrobactrum gallinarii]|uniref:Uncharacterized protein n=1 Tax=Paenochrobactrum gallinarii TaxID=643673 RepID=A0A841LYM3_9HYPH|nr:hypothetical protein [Paenochrobactrum gallinarii]
MAEACARTFLAVAFNKETQDKTVYSVSSALHL